MRLSRACLLAVAAFALAATANGACEDAVTRIGSECCWGYPWDAPNVACDSNTGGYGPDAVFRGYCKKDPKEPKDKPPICTRCTVGAPCWCGESNNVYQCECYRNKDCNDFDPCTYNVCSNGKCINNPKQGCVKPVKLYGQCGGKLYTGSKVCEAGSKCKVQNEWYSQCLPI